MIFFVNDTGGLSKSTDVLDSNLIVSLLSQKIEYISSTYFLLSVFRVSTSSAMYLQFKQKVKVHRSSGFV